MAAKKQQSFEESIGRLDEIVKLLERGEAPLAESLKLFEEGAALITSCSKMLEQAEQKVIKLKKGADGNPVELPFEGDEA